jgi:uncharacterized protein YjiK
MMMSWGISCQRSEPPTDTPLPPGDKNLQLLSVFSLAVGEPSGLAYSQSTHSLYMISDANPAIYRIDTTGKLLATIPVSASDLEGITVSLGEDTLYVVEETLSQVTTFLANGTKISSFPVNVWTDPKHKLEGITRGPDGTLYVLNEKFPTMLLAFSGTTELSRQTLTYSSDVSDICYDPMLDCFWIVSDESQSVMKISRSGTLLGEWSTPVRQGEGIAFIGNRMYIVSDVDAKLYVFVKP